MMNFCTVINCIDGRAQLPIIAYLQERFGAEFVDVITETGPVGVIAEFPDSIDTLSLFRRVDVSINAHASQSLAIVAHHDCAGNPIPDSGQIRQLRICLDIITKRYPGIEVIGLWLDSNWTPQEI